MEDKDFKIDGWPSCNKCGDSVDPDDLCDDCECCPSCCTCGKDEDGG